MILISRFKIFSNLAFILILLFSFDTQAQVAGIATSNPFEQRLNKIVEPNQQSNTANNPSKKSAKKNTKKVKKSKKKSSKSAKKNTKKVKKSKKKSSKSAKKNDSPPTFVYIDPIRDLGINKGYVCFRIKAYSNIEVSDFSRAVCTYIKNSKRVKLAWTPRSNSVIGYQVYFGTSAKITKNFITDVM